MAEFEEGTHSLALPRQFGEYTLLQIIGTGGEAIVYKARNADNELVALKVYRLTLDQEPPWFSHFEEKFLSLNDLVEKVDSDHIVKIYETPVVEGFPVIEMELLQGTTLEYLISNSQQQVDLHILISALADILEAVVTIESHGLYAFDVHSTDNMYVTEDGKGLIIDVMLWTEPSRLPTLVNRSVRYLGITLEQFLLTPHGISLPNSIFQTASRMKRYRHSRGFETYEEVITELRNAAAVSKRDSGGTIAMSSAPPTITTRVNSAKRAPNL